MTKGGNIKGRDIQKNKELNQFRKIVRSALKEDIGKGDVTTESIVDETVRALGVIFAKEDGILCGVDIAQMAFTEIDKSIDFQRKLVDGNTFTAGTTIATITGPACTCLKVERTALNFLQHLSGIATLTRRFVEAARGRIKILDTRKTTPGLRVMEKYAVRTGGGINHRLGLFDMVLIKNNHIEIAGSITKAVTSVRKKRKNLFIEVEVKTFDELNEVLGLKVDRIMLDNMNVIQLRRAAEIVRKYNKNVELEASGGINLNNIEDFAGCDLDFVSIGALTHSARAIDIAMNIKALG